MRSTRYVLAALFIFAAVLTAQTATPLYQVMSTNSLVDRPQVFRDMQDNLEKEFGSKTPGLQIEGLHEAIGSVREEIVEIFANPHVTLTNSNSRLTIKFSDRTIDIDLPNDDTLNKVWLLAKERLTEDLNKKIKAVLTSMNKSSSSTALIDGVISALSQSELLAGIDIKAFSSYERTEKLSAILSAIVVNAIEQKVERELAITDLKWKSDLEKFRVMFENQLVVITSAIRGELITAMNTAENDLSKVIDEASNSLISANSGVGITQGKGSFSGGIYLSAYHDANWQLAAYANGQLNKGDSTKPTESLAGLHVRYGSERFQYDLLFAGLFGDEQFKAGDAGECGGGFSFRTSGIVGGIAIYVLGSKLIHPLFTIGGTIKPATAGGTGFLIGLQGEDGRWQPIIQTSFPILATGN